MENDLVFRLIVLVVLVTTLFISASFRKSARDRGGTIDRREEGTGVLFLRMAFGLPLLLTILLNILYPRALTLFKVELPLYVRLIGITLSILFVPFIYWVFQSIGKNVSETVLTKHDHDLVTHGPYKWVRHPLYTSALLFLLSLSMIFGDWILFLYSIVGWIVFRFLVIPAEERNLVVVFGEEYEAYQNATGMLIPKVF